MTRTTSPMVAKGTDARPVPPAALETSAADSRRKVVVRSYSKAIYFYPTLLGALLLGWAAAADGSTIAGNLFLGLFFANLLIVLYELDAIKMLFLGLVALVLGMGVWILGLAPGLASALEQLHFGMNRQGYWLYAGFFGLLIAGDCLWAHLNRWEFAANDVKHVQVFRGHTANYPGRAMRFQLQTVDVWERLLLGAGTLLLSFGGRKVRIDNVPFAARKVKELEKFVRSAGVFDDAGDVFDGSADEIDLNEA